MDLDDLKKRAKDLFAELTDPRPDQDDRAARDAVDDRGVDDASAQTDRLDRPADRPVADRADPRAEDHPSAPASDLPPGPRHREQPVEQRWDDPAAERAKAPADERWEEPVAKRRAEPVSGRLDEPATGSRDELVSEWRDEPVPQAGRAASATTSTDADDMPSDPERMVTAERADSFAVRWDEVKGEFVDAPRQAVAKADALVGELLDELGALFAQQRRNIEQDFDRDEVSTEELRVALRRYRSFFDRLLSV